MPWIGLTVVALAVLLVSEWRFRPGIRWVKPLASAGFVAFALSRGAVGTPYGRTVLVALVLGWCGDVLLLGTSRRSFLAGLVAFLLGHVAYSVAFVQKGLDLSWILASAFALIPLGATVGAALLRHAPGSLRLPAAIYLTAISVMVALAAGTVSGAGPLLLVAATAFYLSDLFVARQRFLHPQLANKLIGLPLYYGAQLAFAFSVASG